jgi:hypothetical protein
MPNGVLAGGNTTITYCKFANMTVSFDPAAHGNVFESNYPGHTIFHHNKVNGSKQIVLLVATTICFMARPTARSCRLMDGIVFTGKLTFTIIPVPPAAFRLCG